MCVHVIFSEMHRAGSLESAVRRCNALYRWADEVSNVFAPASTKGQLLSADALSCEQRMFTRRMAAKTQTRSKEAEGCKPRPQRVRLKFYRMARMMPQPQQEKMGVRMVKWPPWHQTCPTKSHFFLCSAARSDFGLQRQHCGQEAATLTLCHGGGTTRDWNMAAPQCLSWHEVCGHLLGQMRGGGHPWHAVGQWGIREGLVA